MQTDNPTYAAVLAERIQTLVDAPLSAELVEKFQMCLLDFLAACLSTHGSKVAEIARETSVAYGTGSCLLLGTSSAGSLMGATFHNALIATAEDLDDIHPYASGLHLGATTFPAILGLASWQPHSMSGSHFIKSTIAGYEASSRIVRAAHAGIRKRGLHSSGAAGAFGSCAASGVALGFNTSELANALNIAASSSGGLFAFLKEGASVRHAHAAWAGTNGLGAALMGRAGMTGPLKAIEGYSAQGADGWFGAFAGEWNPEYIMAPADHPELLNSAHKLHAACGHAAPAITALQMLRDQLLPRIDQIRTILIRGYKASAALNKSIPETAAQAKFSLPFLTGLILLHGQATLKELTEENLHSPELQRIASCVSVSEDPEMTRKFPDSRAGEVIVTMDDGEVISQRVDAPLGMPPNPVKLPVLERKFTEAATGVLAEQQIARVISLVHDFPSLDTIAPLFDALRIE